ncbi:MAG: hypothetical protein ACRCXT_18765 [Paraclostridium sp.]
MEFDINNIILTVISSVASIVITWIKMKRDASDKGIKKKIVPSKLIDHMFFTKIISFKNNIYTSFTYDNKGKEELCRWILYNLLKSIDSNFKIVVNEIDKNKNLTKQEVIKLNVAGFEKSYREVRELYKSDNLTNDEIEILKIALPKFNKWNETRLEYMRMEFINIGQSHYYDTNEIIQAVILEMLSSHLSDLLNDARLSLNEINGSLTGKIFKGVEIEPTRNH